METLRKITLRDVKFWFRPHEVREIHREWDERDPGSEAARVRDMIRQQLGHARKIGSDSAAAKVGWLRGLMELTR